MPTPLVECVPNFSEARRPEVVEAIIQEVRSTPGVDLLDRHSDSDHNRTVLTFVGSPQGVEEAAFRSIAKAAELINLDEHSGEHPRIGATDVVPFVPIEGITMKECVEIAKRLGKRVGDTLNIPVYLYEEAATRPDRQNLENIRRGEYEGLKVEIISNPDRKPDFGPSKLGTAGATVIGARQFLVAFNVDLTTGDVAVAKKIAKAIRMSSGGLRYLKANGFLVDGRAQVSMNLTNFHATPLARVVEMIRREAARYGVSIHNSELVGLIPQQALEEAAIWYLQLDKFETHQVLERRLAAVQHEQLDGKSTQPSFLEALAAGTAAPGGGAAAAYSAAAGAALVAMVARLTLGKKKYIDVEEKMTAVLERAEALRLEMTQTIDRDTAAFNALLAAVRLPKETPDQERARALAIEDATLHAANVPLEVAAKAVEIIEIAMQAVQHGNVNAISDGASGAAMARAGLTAAGYNVRINSLGLENREAAQELLEKLQKLEQLADYLEERIRLTLKDRGEMPLP